MEQPITVTKEDLIKMGDCLEAKMSFLAQILDAVIAQNPMYQKVAQAQIQAPHKTQTVALFDKLLTLNPIPPQLASLPKPADLTANPNKEEKVVLREITQEVNNRPENLPQKFEVKTEVLKAEPENNENWTYDFPLVVDKSVIADGDISQDIESGAEEKVENKFRTFFTQNQESEKENILPSELKLQVSNSLQAHSLLEKQNHCAKVIQRAFQHYLQKKNIKSAKLLPFAVKPRLNKITTWKEFGTTSASKLLVSSSNENSPITSVHYSSSENETKLPKSNSSNGISSYGRASSDGKDNIKILDDRQSQENSEQFVKEFLTSPPPSARNGEMIEIYEDGSRYEGEKLNSLRHGSGTYDFGNKYRYIGSWETDEMSGFGTLSLDGKTVYEGEWKNNLFQGRGILHNINHDGAAYKNFQGEDFETISNCWIRYEGEFNKGEKDGLGNLVLPEGDLFVGSFYGGSISGKGSFTKNLQYLLVGIWKNNKFVEELIKSRIIL